MKKRIVIKLSGSIFDPERPALIEKFAVFLVKISKVCQPIVIAGGGKIARHYIEHARNSGADESTLDELGIEISRLNAKLLVCALGKKAYVHPPTTLREMQHAAESGLVVVAGGLHPGQSTNGTAALVAEKVRASEFLNAVVAGYFASSSYYNRLAYLANFYKKNGKFFNQSWTFRIKDTT